MSPPERSAAFWIEHLQLARHPEGGFYRQTYRAGEEIAARALPERYGGPRVFATAIYFLLESGDVSALHRLRSDEMWHFHAGGSLLIHAISPAGVLRTQRLGSDIERGDALQAQVAQGDWFGGEIETAGTYALMSCTVAPGFEFADFELAQKVELAAEYPQHRDLIERLARR